jgi:HK97 family phage prohead protease
MNDSTVLLPPVPVLRHTFALDHVEWRQAENGRSEDFTLRGHAAVFNKLSEDLGGFREILEPGAFRAALRKNPDVRLLFNHDPNYVMARTASGTLELREDQAGLHVWARVAPLAWVADLRASMQRGDIDQMSFAFTLRDEGDDWAVTEDGTVVRTIRGDGVDLLADVSVVTYPAYPQTDAGMRELRTAVEHGRLPASVLGEPDPTMPASAPPDGVAGEDVSRTAPGGDANPNHRLQLARRKARKRMSR